MQSRVGFKGDLFWMVVYWKTVHYVWIQRKQIDVCMCCLQRVQFLHDPRGSAADCSVVGRLVRAWASYQMYAGIG